MKPSHQQEKILLTTLLRLIFAVVIFNFNHSKNRRWNDMSTAEKAAIAIRLGDAQVFVGDGTNVRRPLSPYATGVSALRAARVPVVDAG